VEKVGTKILPYKVGDKVNCIWKGDGKVYPAVISDILD